MLSQAESETEQSRKTSELSILGSHPKPPTNSVTCARQQYYRWQPIVLHMTYNSSVQQRGNYLQICQGVWRNCTEIVVNLWHGLTVTERWVRCARGMLSRLVVGGQSMSHLFYFRDLERRVSSLELFIWICFLPSLRFCQILWDSLRFSHSAAAFHTPRRGVAGFSHLSHALSLSLFQLFPHPPPPPPKIHPPPPPPPPSPPLAPPTPALRGNAAPSCSYFFFFFFKIFINKKKKLKNII